VAIFPAHWAPDALACYGLAKMFPSSYKGGAFIAFHGSWNRAPEPQDGYNVVFQLIADGKAFGLYQVFADAFARTQKGPRPGRTSPDGARRRTRRSPLHQRRPGGHGVEVTYNPGK
jgi:glucose/arabinose dehydrogenase